MPKKYTEEELKELVGTDPDKRIALQLLITPAQLLLLRKLLRQRNITFGKYVHQHIILNCFDGSILSYDDLLASSPDDG